MPNWWQKPLRGLALDLSGPIPTKMELRQLVEKTVSGGVNLLIVSATSVQPGGSAFYPSQIAPAYPNLGTRDLLGEVIAASHTGGQKVIAAVAAIWGSRDLYIANPDWAQRKANGDLTSLDEQNSSVAFCPNSPYREYFKALVKEIGESYPLDGFFFDEAGFQSWCNCWYCQKKYYAEFHEYLPTQLDWQDDAAHRFIAWRYRQIAEWRESLQRLVQTNGRCVIFQGAFPLVRLRQPGSPLSSLGVPNPYQQRFGVEWYVPMAHGVSLAHTASIEDILHFDLQRRSVGETMWWSGVAMRYGQSLARGKSVVASLQPACIPFERFNLPETELRLTVGEALANSASPMLIYSLNRRQDQRALDTLLAILKQARAMEAYLEERDSVKYAALLFSQASLERCDHRDDQPAHLDCFKGFAKALLQEKLLFDVVTEDDLAEHLWRYKVLILPNVSCMSAKAKRAVRLFFSSGGGVVGSFATGQFDELGQRTPGDDFARLFGVRYQAAFPLFHGLDVYMHLQAEVNETTLAAPIPAELSIPTGGIQVEVEPDGGKVVARIQGGVGGYYTDVQAGVGPPSVVVYEKENGGRSVYFAPPLGSRYLEFGIPEYRRLIAAAVQYAARGLPSIRVYNAPLTLQLTAYWQASQKRLVIHLLNSLWDASIQPLEEVPECRDVDLRLDVNRDVEDVEILGLNTKPVFTLRGKALSVKIPPFRYHAVVAVRLSYP